MILKEININSIEGSPFDWSSIEGKKILFVNVASECGFTPQYAELQGLYEEFSNTNFTIIGVPCNDFGAQEPGSAEQIVEFCTKRFGVTFPLTEKISVLGDSKHPLYQFLTSIDGKEVEWNFQKYLVDEKGTVVKVLAPGVSPFDDEIVNWIEN